MNGRFLPGVPAAEIESIFNAAAGNEIASGKFDSPESSAALAANGLGFFLHRPRELPPLPGCEAEAWPARLLSIETVVRFPWSGGRHPVLDGLLKTPSALIGIESKRYEPFRSSRSKTPSDAYWRDVWGERMDGYQRIRDSFRPGPTRQFTRLDAAQLFKHAFALRTEAHRRAWPRLKPILFYLYAEPEFWPSGKPVDERAKARHREEIERFSATVADDEVRFVPCAWRRLLDGWRHHPDEGIRAHAQAVTDRYSP